MMFLIWKMLSWMGLLAWRCFRRFFRGAIVAIGGEDWEGDRCLVVFCCCPRPRLVAGWEVVAAGGGLRAVLDRDIDD